MYNVIIEISKGSNMKYEYDKDAECLRLDRILHNSNVFPYNYGYIPGTLSDDGDPLDIIILCDYPIQPDAMVSCKIVVKNKMVYHLIFLFLFCFFILYKVFYKVYTSCGSHKYSILFLESLSYMYLSTNI